jgi:hypothetical protein
MSEELEPYKYSPPAMEESWGYRFAIESSRFIYFNGRYPKEAFVSNKLIESMKKDLARFEIIKDSSLPLMPDGSYGTYNDITIYSTSKPGITFA